MPKIVLPSLALVVTGVLASYSLFAQTDSSAQVATPPQLHGYYTHVPWTGGTHSDAQFQAAAGTTIPLATYSIVATKDNRTYNGTIVGTSPFAATKSGSTINTVVVPIKITIGTSVFDPTVGDSCDGNVSAQTRLLQSPLVANVANLTINGVNVGTSQYVNGVRRAEFWSTIGGSASYQNPLSFTFASSYTISAATVGSHGTTYSSGCHQLGIVSNSWLDSYLRGTVMPALTASGVISPAKFVVFLFRNVVQSSANPPSVNQCCILGYHGATGNPVQTYTPFTWDTTGDFGIGTADGTIASHEIAEWMDDPLGTNATPAWGNIGQVSGCQGNWENGDPLSGTLMPAITLGGKAYHMQELGFYSWYFNKSGSGSVGTGGKFSSNGKFAGPSKACPPGGTF